MSRHLCIGVLPSKHPLDTSLFGVASLLPRIDFSGEQGPVGQTPIKTLAIQYADLDFSHIEPTGVLRGVVKYNAAQKCLRFFDVEHFLEAFAEVGVEVVQDQMDAACCGIDLFEQELDKCDEINFGTAIRDHNGAASAFGLYRYEQVAGAGANILVILSHGHSRLDRPGDARVLEHLLALFVQTNDGLPRSKWASVEIEQIVHTFPIFLGQSADTPHQLAPRLEAVFLAAGGRSRD